MSKKNSKVAPDATRTVDGVAMSLWSVPTRTKADVNGCGHSREIVLASDRDDASDQAAKALRASRGWIVNGLARPYAAPGFAELPLLAWPDRY